MFADILATGILKASGPFGFGWARKVDEVQRRHHSVCFSEVPLDKIERLTRRHGNYGIAFAKDFIRDRQGARVWYIDQGSEQAHSLMEHLRELKSRRDFSHPMWDLTPFIDPVMPGRYIGDSTADELAYAKQLGSRSPTSMTFSRPRFSTSRIEPQARQMEWGAVGVLPAPELVPTLQVHVQRETRLFGNAGRADVPLVPERSLGSVKLGVDDDEQSGHGRLKRVTGHEDADVVDLRKP